MRWDGYSFGPPVAGDAAARMVGEPGRRSSGAIAGRASGGETLSAPHLQQYEKQAGCGGQVAPDPFPVMAGPAARDLTILHPQRALRDRSDLHYAPDHAGR